MTRLVVVSNRVAPVDEGKQQAGGLAVALSEALRRTGGLWFGWSGAIVDAPSPTPRIARSGRMTLATLDLSQQEIDDYYNGYANATLWPLFHYRLGLVNFTRRYYEGYRAVNARFAAALQALLRPGDVVWVHDYHLIPLAEELRRRGVTQRIGFFLHTPFAPPELLVALPHHQELVRALAAYDLVGFQTGEDLRAFAEYVETETNGSLGWLSDGSVDATLLGHTVRAAVYPISVDTDDLMRLSRESVQSKATERLVSSLVGRRLIIGVDRLDYSKGLPQRFEAFRHLLDVRPEHRGQVSYLQIAPPTRTDVPEYQQIRRDLEMMAGNVNGRFAEFDWVPIRYLNSGFGRRTLAGFYRAASVGLVTPLRDGMNLVAKEYVACQDPDDPGVLVLSRFAGAARELRDAVIVNPFDVEGVADALHLALTMPLEERRRRHQLLLASLRENDIAHWRDTFLRALRGAAPDADTVAA